MKKIIFIVSMLLLVFIGCNSEVSISDEPAFEPDPEVAISDEPAIEPVPEPVIEEPVDLSCTDSSECEGQCIDGTCGTVTELYNFECEAKCNYNKVVIKTSDGQEYTLNRGQGSYTGAGALEWKLLGGPDYCTEKNIPVPMKLIYKKTGEILGEEVIVLHVGETSNVLKHPTIASIQFTTTLVSINEEC